MERNCIVFAKSYEEFAGNRDMAAETAPDGTRLLPDDDATAEIHRAYHLTAATYKAAKAKLRPEDTVIFHWFHPGAFRYELGNMPADQRLAHARKRIKEVGDAYQWARADRLIGMPRNARAAAQEGGEAIRPAGKREERKK
jgi:hypothetical protein